MSFKDKIDSLLDEAIAASLQEKKLDPVNKKALDKDFDDRDDKDIDNDGDVDSSDEYLHNRRKAVKKAMAKEDVELGEAAKMSANAQTWYRKGYEMGKDPSKYQNPPYGIGGAAMDAFRKGRKAGAEARNKKEEVETNEGTCGTMNASTLKAMAKKKKLNAEKY